MYATSTRPLIPAAVSPANSSFGDMVTRQMGCVVQEAVTIATNVGETHELHVKTSQSENIAYQSILEYKNI